MCFYKHTHASLRSSCQLMPISFCIFVLSASGFTQNATEVSIEGEKFFINGSPTYQGVSWRGYPVEGLLFTARMVQGVFDDLNPQS